VLDVLWIVAPMSEVLSPAEIAEAEEGFPRDGHNTAAATDAGELSHGTLGRFEVLENFEARDDIDTVIGEWQHSRVRPDTRGPGKPLQRHGELVGSIFDADQQARVCLHRFQCQPFAYAHIDPGATRRTRCLSESSQHASDELSHDDVTAGVLCFILSCGQQRGTGRQADGLRSGRLHDRMVQEGSMSPPKNRAIAVPRGGCHSEEPTHSHEADLVTKRPFTRSARSGVPDPTLGGGSA